MPSNQASIFFVVLSKTLFLRTEKHRFERVGHENTKNITTCTRYNSLPKYALEVEFIIEA